MSPWIQLPPKRRKPRRGEPTRKQRDELRLAVYGRAGGLCELHLVADCIPGVLPYDGPSPFDHGHLVHLRARRIGGWSMDNCRWGCWPCHLVGLHNPKACPPKPRPQESVL